MGKILQKFAGVENGAQIKISKKSIKNFAETEICFIFALA